MSLGVSLRLTAFTCAVLLAGRLAHAAVADADRDGVPDVVEQKLGSPTDARQRFTLVAASPDNRYSDEAARRNAPDIVRLEACHVGSQRLLFKITFGRKPVFAGSTFIIYLDLDNNPKTGRVDRYHGGVDVMVSVRGDSVNVTLFGAKYRRDNTIPCATVFGRALYVSLDAPLHVVDGRVVFGVHLLSQRPGGRGDSTRHAIARLPYYAYLKAPVLPRRRSTSLRNLSDYRFYNDKVKYEKLSDKGLTYEQIAPKKPIRFGRPRPLPQDAGRMWSFALWAAGDIGVELRGAPPFLSLRKADWFLPRAFAGKPAAGRGGAD